MIRLLDEPHDRTSEPRPEGNTDVSCATGHKSGHALYMEGRAKLVFSAWEEPYYIVDGKKLSLDNKLPR